MRYKVDENNYITYVFFNCYVGTCAEYTGNIPDGYTSLEEWASNATIEAYYLSNGNLVYDSAREAELQAKWEEELQNNTPKEYELPTASATTLGGIKVGAGLSINSGVLSATGGGTADSVDWSNVQNKPTKVSQFTNDAGYQTATQVEATVTGKGYQTASDVNTIVSNEIKAKIPNITDNLNSTSTTDALSANQGKILNDKLSNAITVRLSASQSNSIDGESTVVFSIIDFQLGNIFSLQPDGGIKCNISCDVEINAVLRFGYAAASTKQVLLYKNSEVLINLSQQETVATTQTIPSYYVSVNANDVIYLKGNTNAGSFVRSGTFMSIKRIN